jgi:FtsP/CotA-like multicopper oxidase with cupredoxin domain
LQVSQTPVTSLSHDTSATISNESPGRATVISEPVLLYTEMLTLSPFDDVPVEVERPPDSEPYAGNGIARNNANDNAASVGRIERALANGGLFMYHPFHLSP